MEPLVAYGYGFGLPGSDGGGGGASSLPPPEVSVALSGNKSRQQGVPQAEQSSKDLSFHRVDPLVVLSGLLHELPEGIELVSGLECGLLGCDTTCGQVREL